MNGQPVGAKSRYSRFQFELLKEEGLSPRGHIIHYDRGHNPSANHANATMANQSVDNDCRLPIHSGLRGPSDVKPSAIRPASSPGALEPDSDSKSCSIRQPAYPRRLSGVQKPRHPDFTETCKVSAAPMAAIIHPLLTLRASLTRQRLANSWFFVPRFPLTSPILENCLCTKSPGPQLSFLGGAPMQENRSETGELERISPIFPGHGPAPTRQTGRSSHRSPKSGRAD